MKVILTLLTAYFVWLVPSAQAADPAYSYLVMEAGTSKDNTGILVVGVGDEKPGEIAFGKIVDGAFVGQRLLFRPVDYHSKKIEVIAEDVKAPELDQPSGLKVQNISKKVFRLDADGKSREILIGGKRITFKTYTIWADHGNKKLLIEEDDDGKSSSRTEEE